MMEDNRNERLATSRSGAYQVAERVHLHHSAQPLSKEQALAVVAMWMDEADQSVTVGEALNAVRTFYAQHAGRDGVRCRVEDVNRLVRRARVERLPSDMWLADYATGHGLIDGERVWLFKRTVKSMAGEGADLASALRAGLARARGERVLVCPDSPLLDGFSS